MYSNAIINQRAGLEHDRSGSEDFKIQPRGRDRFQISGFGEKRENLSAGAREKEFRVKFEFFHNRIS